MQIAADPNTVLLAGDVLKWATDKTTAIQTLVVYVAGAMVVIAILMAYWRTKSWVATVVAVLLGAFVLWGIANMTIMRDKVGTEINEPANGPAQPGGQ